MGTEIVLRPASAGKANARLLLLVSIVPSGKIIPRLSPQECECNESKDVLDESHDLRFYVVLLSVLVLCLCLDMEPKSGESRRLILYAGIKTCHLVNIRRTDPSSKERPEKHASLISNSSLSPHAF